MDTEDTWPPVTREPRPWSTNPDQRGMSGTRPNEADRLLESITVEIPARIARRQPRLAPEVIVACEEAAQEVAALEARSVQLSGLGELLVRTEAVATSKIERINADMDEYARASIGADAGEQARRTAAAAEALTTLAASTSGHADLTNEAILAAHRALLADDPHERSWAGRYRQQQNWIGGSDFSPRTAVHVPPRHEDVEPLMDDLVRFANRDDLSAIAQAAISHAQFESIHPFTDGNGRIGRALMGAVLRRRGVTPTVTVPIAAAMLSDVDMYFDRLRDYREGDVDSLTLYVARAASTAASAAEESADRLAGMPAIWHASAPARRGSSTRNLIDGLLRSPILDIERAEAITGSSRARTYEAIDRLVDAGVLEEITGAGRNRIWSAVDVMTELSNLEERIGARARPHPRWLRADS